MEAYPAQWATLLCFSTVSVDVYMDTRFFWTGSKEAVHGLTLELVSDRGYRIELVHNVTLCSSLGR